MRRATFPRALHSWSKYCVRSEIFHNSFFGVHIVKLAIIYLNQIQRAASEDQRPA
jgi:hypothetical protein